jgi:hypothetical protein
MLDILFVMTEIEQRGLGLDSLKIKTNLFQKKNIRSGNTFHNQSHLH